MNTALLAVRISPLRTGWLHVLLLCIVHAAVFWAVVAADPAAMHNHEILAPAAAAHEFNRGTISLRHLPDFLNGEITIGETLFLAGCFRLYGATYPVTLLAAYLIAALSFLLWHRLAAVCAGPRAATVFAVLLACAPPAQLLLSTQIDSRHNMFNLFCPLLLLLYLHGVCNRRHLPAAVFALLCIPAVLASRTILLLLAVCALHWFARRLPAWQTLLPAGMLALALTVTFPGTGSALLRFHQWSLPEMACTRWSPESSLQLFTRLFTAVWPDTYGFPAPGGTAYLLLLALAVVATVCRRSPAGTLGRLLAGFMLAYLTALIVLRLDTPFDWYDVPRLWRYRYLLVLGPSATLFIGMALARFPAPARRLAVAALIVLSAVALPGEARFRSRPLAAYLPFNYAVMGEAAAGHFTRTTPPSWHAFFTAVDPRYRRSLVSGMAAAAVNPDFADNHYDVVERHLPPGARDCFLYACGYWAAYYRAPAAPLPAFARFSVHERGRFAAGAAAAGDRREWWPEYHRVPLRFGLTD